MKDHAAMEAIHQRLAGSSSHFAQSALAAFAAGDHDTFAISAGVSLEHVLKAFLAKRHPVLIVGSDFDALLLACGYEKDAKPRYRIRSIGAAESLTRVGQ